MNTVSVSRRTPGTLGARLSALLLTLSLAGCAVPSFLSFKGDKVKWKQVTLAAKDDANHNSPVAVDVVFVTSETMRARLAELPASKWFAGREDLSSTFPKEIRYRGWEVVPGQRLEIAGDEFEGPRVAAAFVFANYPEPGSHRVRIDQFSGTLVIQLDAAAFTVSTTK
jgi:type VI secretion system protein